MLLSAHDSNRVLLWGALHKHWLLHCNWHFRSLFGIACSEHGMYSLITESGKTWRGGGAGETRASVLNVTAAGSICYLRCDKSTLVWVHPGRTWKMQPKMVWEEWIWKMSTEMEGRVGRKGEESRASILETPPGRVSEPKPCYWACYSHNLTVKPWIWLRPLYKKHCLHRCWQHSSIAASLSSILDHENSRDFRTPTGSFGLPSPPTEEKSSVFKHSKSL